MKRRAHWHYVKVDHVQRIVWIADDDGPLSVTNDAELVTYEALGEYEDGKDVTAYRLIYKDSDGNWDELVHDKKSCKFIGFAPARDHEAPCSPGEGKRPDEGI